MRNALLGFIILCAVFISCKKDTACNMADSNVTASATEIANVQNYLTTNSISGTTQHPSGFFYKITQAGTGQVIANLCSTVSVTYTGRLTNGTYFDPTTPGTTSSIAYPLGQLIVGWQKGLPLISAGGKITLYIPPSLGYGSSPAGSIPANSILIFDIQLVAVAN